jgi:FtsZ-binding cell division protein ZapB
MSTIEVNKITPVSGGTTVQVGESGDTINIPAGATIANAGTATGFGVSLANGADNRVVTASSASALNGETNFIYNGTIVGAGANGSSADLGVGLHIKTADSGASVNTDADQLVIEGSTGSIGMSILSATDGTGDIYFGDSGNNASGYIQYNHANNFMRFAVNGATERVRIKQYDFCVGTTSPISTNGITFKAGTTAGDDWISSYRTTASTPHYIHAFYSDAGGTQTAKYAIYADGTASAISDVNYKKNITNARNYLEDLEKIDVIKYNLKTDNEDEFKKLGFSAQQVETIFPNMIDTDNTPLKEFYEEGDEIPEGKTIGDIKKTTAREVKLLKKEIFVPMLVKAVQELSAKVKTLETENTDIKAKIETLETENTDIKARLAALESA